MMTSGNCGVSPTVCGSQPSIVSNEAVVLGTPPGTDAEQCGVHLLVEILCLTIRTQLFLLRCLRDSDKCYEFSGQIVL